MHRSGVPEGVFMEHKKQIPSFIHYYLEAERILRQPLRIDRERDVYVLFYSFESILREILSDLLIYDEGMWTLGRITNEVLAKCKIPPSIGQGLGELVEHRNMAVHASPAAHINGFIFLDDLDKVRSLAVWYLRDFPKGPQYNDERITELLSGDQFPLPKTIFISYAREDEVYASNLYDALRGRRHKPWMDKRDLIAGQEWENEIRKAIEKSDFFIALMSSTSVTKKGFIQKEIRFALDVLGEMPPGRIYFIPARIEPCDVPDIIKHFQWVDLPNDKNYHQIFRAIENV
jgi:hypothetical protein